MTARPATVTTRTWAEYSAWFDRQEAGEVWIRRMDSLTRNGEYELHLIWPAEGKRWHEVKDGRFTKMEEHAWTKML